MNTYQLIKMKLKGPNGRKNIYVTVAEHAELDLQAPRPRSKTKNAKMITSSSKFMVFAHYNVIFKTEKTRKNQNISPSHTQILKIN